MTTMQRRTFLTAGLGLVAAGALASCSRSSDDGGGDAGSSGAAGLRVAWYGGQPVTDGLTAALADFGTDNPDLTVTTESAPFDEYWDRLATQTAGGDSPDVMRMSMTYFDDYASRGALLDVASLLADGSIDASGLDADVAASGDIAGGTFGVGQSSIVYAVFVDPAQLEAVGLEAPETGWTWDDFESMATAYADAAPDDSFFCNDNGGAFQAFEVYARQQSGDLFTADGAWNVSADVIEAWFSMWAGWRDAGIVPPGDLTAETTGFENALLVKGKSPMQWGWVQQVTFYQPLTDNPLQVISVPSASDGDLSGLFVKALDFWCISADTADPASAAKVVDFLLNDERAITSIGLTLGVPPSQTARDLLAPDPDSAEGRAIAYVEAVSGEVGPPPPPWPVGYGEISGAFARANESVAFGEADAASAAASVMSAAESALA